MNPATLQLIFNMVQLIGAATRMSPEIAHKYTEHKTKIKQLLDEGREPTEEEHAELNASITNLLDQL